MTAEKSAAIYNIPAFAYGRHAGNYDCSQRVRMSLFREADMSGFLKYLDEVADAGFVLLSKRQSKDFAYTGFKAKCLQLFVYYTANDASLRVIADSFSAELNFSARHFA